MWPSLITGGLGLIGSMFGASTSAANTQQQIQASMMQQQSANEFTERMSNTAYQRASADMQKAGLNPMMMFGSGSAASTPSASTIQAPMPQTKSALADLGTIAEQSLNAAVRAKGLDKMSEEISNLQTERTRIAAQAATETRRPALVEAETRDIKAGARLKELAEPVSTVEAEKAVMLEELIQSPVTRKVLQGGALGKSASDALSPFLDLLGGISNSALRLKGLQMLKEKMKGNPSSYRRGYEAGRLEE